MAVQQPCRHLDVGDSGGMTVARFTLRELTSDTTLRAIHEQMLGLAEGASRRTLLVDFASVEYLSGGLFRTLIMLQRRLEAGAGRLILCNLHGYVHEVFKVTRLDHFFDLRRGRPDEPPPPPDPYEVAFIGDVAESPEDDGVRLVCADWLEEKGAGADAGARAEFIRAQVSLARMSPETPGRRELEARAGALLRAHERTWTAPVAGFVSDLKFRRGFIEEVELSGQSFLDHAPELFRRAPVRRARFLIARGLVPALASSPYLARLAEVDFRGNGIDAAAVQALVHSPYLEGATLQLAVNSLGDEGVRAVRERFGDRVRF